MIRSLRICNFKSWADTGQMRLAPITGLFGTNSSGKTSLLQLLLLLKQTVESTDRAPVLNLGGERSYVEFGTFRDALHKHDVAGAMEWSLTWALREPMTIADPRSPGRTLFTLDRLSLAAKVQALPVAPAFPPVVDRFAYSLSGSQANGREARFGMARREGELKAYDLIAVGYEPRFRPPRETVTNLLPPIRFYGFPADVYAFYEDLDFLAQLQLAFEKLTERMFYLGPLREPPKRQYLWAGSPPTDVGQRGERAIDALLAASAFEAEADSYFRDNDEPLSWIVAEWLRKLGLIEAFGVQPMTEGGSLFQVHAQTTADAAPVLLPDVGFGVSQILPVLVLCYYVPKGSTIIFEQPELHLHPSVQAELAEVLIHAVKTRGVQIILESHSEHLLHRLQRRIAEERLTPEDTALYFCDVESGASRLTPLELDTFGNITNWPPNFFGDDMGDLFAMTEAAMKRQIAAGAD